MVRRKTILFHREGVRFHCSLASYFSAILTTPTESRGLREFEVSDNAPPRQRVTPWKGDGAPSRLEPRAWDGRNLATFSQPNFPRGSYRSPPKRAPRGKGENSAGFTKGNTHGRYKSVTTSLPYGDGESK